MASKDPLICLDCGRHYYEEEPAGTAPPPAAGEPISSPAVPVAIADAGTPESPPAPSAERVCKYCGSSLIRKQ